MCSIVNNLGIAEVIIAFYLWTYVGKRKLLWKAEMLIIVYVSFHFKEKSIAEAGIVSVKGNNLDEFYESDDEEENQLCLNINLTNS